MDPENLNKCLRGELAAIETYEQALEKNRAAYGSDPKFQELSRMLEDHRQAAAQLRTLIERMGGAPSTDSGAWGTWSNTVMGTAKLLGDKAALKALKEGEESGIKQYEALANDPNAPADVRTTISTLLERDRAHLQELDRIMETA